MIIVDYSNRSMWPLTKVSDKRKEEHRIIMGAPLVS